MSEGKDSDEKMGKKYCVDIYTDRTLKWFRDYESSQRQSQYGRYKTLTVDSSREAEKIIRKAKHLGIRTRAYSRDFDRENDCRKRFLQVNKPPYRCRYCGKIITEREIEVDHLIPVARAKKSAAVRRKLKKSGMDSVNDIKNLVPACRRCNRRKGDKMGIWYIKGKLGASDRYWTVRRKVQSAVVIVCVAMILVVIKILINIGNVIKLI